jgi:hypothetical protein
MDSIFIVISSFFVLFSIFILVGLGAARLRLKRSKRLIEDMVREYESDQRQSIDDTPLHDNVLEFRAQLVKEHEKNNK